jgi:AcrR family transcriptional regulator
MQLTPEKRIVDSLFRAMAQQQKEHVRQAILAAARRRFAEHGVRGASLADIAASAGTSIGNLYKYFADKDDLLRGAVPETLPRAARALLRQQVEALGTERDALALPDDHPYRQAAARTLAFSIAHRFELGFLLRHAAGTPFESFPDDVIADMTRLSAGYAARVHRGLVLGAAQRRSLRRIYRGYIGFIASILAEEQSPAALAEATRSFAAYHLAGLGAFFALAASASPRKATT